MTQTKKKGLPTRLVLNEDAKELVLISGIKDVLKTLKKSTLASAGKDEMKKALNKVREGVTAFNNEVDPEKRKKIYFQLLEYFDPAQKIKLKLDARFEVDNNGNLYLDGTRERIPEYLKNRILDHLDNDIPIEPLVLFWKRLLLNPDIAVRQQLYSFMQHNDIAITSKGYIYAVKAVKAKGGFDPDTGKRKVTYSEETGEQVTMEINSNTTFMPHHRGGEHGNTIKIGEPVTMPREECDSNPNNTCSRGLHVGAWSYVGGKGFSGGGFGGNDPDNVILEVLVCPSSVVSVPTDYNGSKMRCCMYFPIGISNGENTTIYKEEDFDKHTVDSLKDSVASYKDEIQAKIKALEAQLKTTDTIANSLF